MNDTLYKPYKSTLADAQKEAIIAGALDSQASMVKAIGDYIDKVDVSKLFSKIIEGDDCFIPAYSPIHYSVRLSRKPGYVAWDEIQ